MGAWSRTYMPHGLDGHPGLEREQTGKEGPERVEGQPIKKKRYRWGFLLLQHARWQKPWLLVASGKSAGHAGKCSLAGQPCWGYGVPQEGAAWRQAPYCDGLPRNLEVLRSGNHPGIESTPGSVIKETILPYPATTSSLSLAVRKGDAPRVTVETITGGGGSEAMSTMVAPQVGGPCSVVRVLEWKEGVTVLPGSSLKFRMNDFGTLEVVSDRKTPVVEPAIEEATGMVEMSVDTTQTFTATDPAVSPGKDVVVMSSGHCEGCNPGKEKESTEELHRDPLGDKPSMVESTPMAKVAVLNPELLKPMKKRKRKEYLSPSDEESEMETMEEKTEDIKSAEEICINYDSIEDSRQSQPAPEELKKEDWVWSAYLEDQKSIAAPLKLFHEFQTIPQMKNNFKVGMKLEGIDPQHPSMYFVLTVAEVCGYRIRLHFDGYSDCHDFWVNANSPDIHWAGWCERTGHKLYTPKGCKEEEFTWSGYLKITKSQAAPKEFFTSSGELESYCGFRVGMKLEAVDRMNPSLICVATVTDVVDNRFLVHFDNWDDTYDYWCDAGSPYIHPIGWCHERGRPLTPPQDYPDPDNFSWEKYLEETGSVAAPAHAFKPVRLSWGHNV
ncbi:LMBL1 protein, partial [Polypterus senegalus]